MTNRIARLATLTAITAGLILGQGTAHADHTGALCTTDADCASLGYTGELGYGVTEDKIRTYSDFYVTREDTTDDHSNPDLIGQCLYDLGYRGLPGDGMEAIYAPTHVIEACASQH